MSDIVKFIVRRELLLVLCSSMIVLRRWRASFINALRDLNLSGSEEMDLLVKWFGSEISRSRQKDKGCAYLLSTTRTQSYTDPTKQMLKFARGHRELFVQKFRECSNDIKQGPTEVEGVWKPASGTPSSKGGWWSAGSYLPGHTPGHQPSGVEVAISSARKMSYMWF